MDTAGKGMLSVSEAAAALGIPRRTIVRWVLSGRIHGERVGPVWAIPASEVERLQTEGRPRLGLPKGTKLSRRYQGICEGCGQPFQAVRPARFCSPRCSARVRARERAQARRTPPAAP